MFSKITNYNLAKTATYGAVLTIGMGVIYQISVQKKIKDSQVYQDSVKILLQHQAAVSLLGPPIGTKWVKIEDNESNIWSQRQIQFQIPLKGSIQKGVLHVWANRELSDNPQQEELIETPYKIERLELGLEKEINRRLVVYKNEFNK